MKKIDFKSFIIGMLSCLSIMLLLGSKSGDKDPIVFDELLVNKITLIGSPNSAVSTASIVLNSSPSLVFQAK